MNHIDARLSSFRVTLYKYDIPKVFIHAFWPPGIECKMWREQSVSDNNEGGNLDYIQDY